MLKGEINEYHFIAQAFVLNSNSFELFVTKGHIYDYKLIFL